MRRCRDHCYESAPSKGRRRTDHKMLAVAPLVLEVGGSQVEQMRRSLCLKHMHVFRKLSVLSLLPNHSPSPSSTSLSSAGPAPSSDAALAHGSGGLLRNSSNSLSISSSPPLSLPGATSAGRRALALASSTSCTAFQRARKCARRGPPRGLFVLCTTQKCCVPQRLCGTPVLDEACVVCQPPRISLSATNGNHFQSRAQNSPPKTSSNAPSMAQRYSSISLFSSGVATGGYPTPGPNVSKEPQSGGERSAPELACGRRGRIAGVSAQ